ncbi:aldolase [Aureimonas fodinaquatilis]|uniref:3-oxo-tetronate 4-phosphate decarboxylase n=1 Tax=Aureimonas fodinaquatilis TaxID=2565783 RepID=A0A5B0E243_9HYPH|nr:3-oxo-tetronate 4-phosphate decarboxylase [Aureimonas fodinaquatilis]KAA0972372.1 aldolase [Aureimonas fodinaquatilis]
MNEAKARELICAMGHRLYQRRLVHGTAGNISLRLEDGWLVTPTNTCLGELDPASISRLDATGRLIAGDKPSKEAFLHTSVYDVRPDAQAIIHTHSTHSVAVSCMDHPHGCPPIEPLTAYYVMRVGELALVPYYRPGDKRLADAVREVAVRHACVLLANHGPVIAGKGLNEALYALEELEETARLKLLLDGHRTKPLTAEQVAELTLI